MPLENAALITVIVVTYNRLSYLKLTIDSILQQTYKNLEILVIGDGDQTDVKKYVEQLVDFQVEYLFVPHCGYPAKARNLGIETAKGSFIAFCDDDDLWHPNKLEHQMQFFNQDSSLDLCFTNRTVIDAAGNIIEGKGLNWIPSKTNLSTILLTNFISYSSVLLKKEILIKTGLFPDELKFKAIEDYHLWIRIASCGKLYFLNEKLVHYRIHENNITKKLSVGAKSVLLIFKDLFPQLRLNYYLKLKAYMGVYTKYIIYRIKGI